MWDKNRNPRSFLPTGNFLVATFDHTGNQIADGAISNLKMKSPIKFKSLKVTPFSKVNGETKGYTFEVSFNQPSENGD